jgi:hypothetical protein
MPDWLPDLSAWTPADIAAASSVGTFIVALVAVTVARRQLKQARELREEEAAPYVVADIVPDPVSSHLLNLIIENIGRTPARDVRITFDPPLEAARDHGFPVRDWAPLRDGIETLVPARRLSALFDNSVDRFNSELPMQYGVRVDCNDGRGRRQPRVEFTLDLRPLYGALRAEVKGVHHLVKEVEKIHKALEPITKKKLRVEVYDGESEEQKRAQRREERERAIEQYEARQAEARAQQAEPPPDGQPGTGVDRLGDG